MTEFAYRDGQMFAEDVALEDIAREHGTPLYCYSAARIRRNFQALQGALRAQLPGHAITICYACKANSNLAILTLLRALGAGLDVVSLGEILRGDIAGFPAGKTVFSGVGKTAAELTEAVTRGLLQINVESVAELDLLESIARAKRIRPRVALRVNPDVDAGTHEKITTGKLDNKFGIHLNEALTLYRAAHRYPSLDFAGIAMHIGSQLVDLDPFRLAFEKLAEAVATLRQDGIPIRQIDLGGGIGIPYDDEAAPDLAAYARIVRDTAGAFDAQLIFEPGRLLVGNAGILLTRVLYQKQSGQRQEGQKQEDRRNFVILDAAMNDLMRPALYDAFHKILPCRLDSARTLLACDVVGPVCETGDTFAAARSLPRLEQGELVAIMTAGAYGFSMASTYNSRPLVAEVMTDGGNCAIIRKRQSYEDMMARETVPHWLKGA